MLKSIRAVYKQGVFRPLEQVDIVDGTVVDIVALKSGLRATWDDFFAEGLTIGSAGQGCGDEELEMKGDDFLF